MNRMRVRGGYGLVGLVLVLVMAVTILPWIRSTFAPRFPEGFQAMASAVGMDTLRSDCKGVLCKEGEFCQGNVCRAWYPTESNKYFPDK
jgi:hypothetical protein